MAPRIFNLRPMNKTDDEVLEKYEDLLLFEQSKAQDGRVYFVNILKDTIYDLKVKKQARIESENFIKKQQGTSAT